MALLDLPADARPREKLLARGPAALSDTELLALLLRTGLPGRGVLALAQELVERFGGLAGLLQADAPALGQVRGLGGSAKRSQLLAVLEIARRAMAQHLQERPAMDSLPRVAEYLQLHLAHRPHEVFAALLSEASGYPREVVLRALHHRAAAVVLAHNHPSGRAWPSRADEALTVHLRSALGLVDVRVLDHVIVAPGGWVSMAQEGLL